MVCVGCHFNWVGDDMSKYSNYYEQIKSANCFPIDIKAVNTSQVVKALQRLVKEEKLPLIVKRKLDRITVNKKADA